MQSALAVIRTLDRVTALTVPALMLLLVPLILANVVEVLMRYVFDTPTTWAADVTVMAYGSLFMLGAAYALLKGAHMRTDMLWDRFSNRTKASIDAVAFVLLFLPVMAVIFWLSLDGVIQAYTLDERSTVGLWRPVVWPFRAVIPASALLLFLQGVSETIKSLWTVRTGTPLVQHEKIEI
jgi:TRAP-type mannitol/chloroaromatic compound transport system permease small subunit